MELRNDSDPDITQVLGIGHSRSKGKVYAAWIVLSLLVASAAAGAIIWWSNNNTDAARYKTRKVQRGDLTVTVTATGRLEPTNQVDVGSELSGIIRTVEADYNDQVKAGQVLASLDTSKLEAQVLKSRASLEAAQARVRQVQATIRETEGDLARLKKVLEISGGKVPSQRELDAAEALFRRAQADEAAALAAVAEARSTLDANETDLSKAVIRSPVDGIVLTRAVEPGQTVAASLQAPVLFTLAENLTKMELHVDVDEADVGQVREGQTASFTVDAYPEKTFSAKITQVRFGSQKVEGVVTYETVLTVNNSDLSLRPGMTATADITVNRIDNAFLVPNAALRFSPPGPQEKSEDVGFIDKLLPRRPRRRSGNGSLGKENNGGLRVWVLDNTDQRRLIPVAVKTGFTDGSVTAITEGNLEPGQDVVVGTETAAE